MSTLLLRHSSASASVLLLRKFVLPPVVLRSILFPAWLHAVTDPYLSSVTSPVGKISVAAHQAPVMEQAPHLIQNGLLAVPRLQPVHPLLTLARLCKPHSPSLIHHSYSPHPSDPSGALNFSGKAILHSSGVDFSNGPSFAINMNQLQLGEELGSGAYGTVKRVLHKPTNVAMAMKVFPSSVSTPLSLTPYRKSVWNSTIPN